MIYFNPLDKFFKNKIGAICADEKTTFRVKGDFGSVVLLLKKDGENDCTFYDMKKCDGFFEFEFSLGVGLYFYCFNIDGCKFIGKGEGHLGVLTDNPKQFQLTVYSKDYTVPKTILGGVIYQIFPDRFCRGEKVKSIEKGKILHENWDEIPIFEPNEFGQVMNNDFFGGDFKGIISKIDYLKELGVTTLYLNPIFKAFSNHRYDTGDYMSIDSLLGDENDFITLIKLFKEKGISIVLDGVFNHTGDDSVYFNKYGNYDSVGAYQSKNSKYYGWYNFTNHPNEYDSWWGIKVLPAVNEDNENYVDFITGENGVIEKYTRLGVAGWRLDVVDELPDNFVKKIRKAVKKANDEAIIIGEVWEDASNKISYGVRREYFQGEELDSVMNYPLKNAILDFVLNKNSKNLSNTIKEQIDHYPSDVLHSLMNILSTHDTFRLLTIIGGESVEGKTKKEMASLFIPESELAIAKQKLKIASLLQFSLCGVPSIYYGDEVGMQGYVDPLNRRTYPWGKEDKELLSWYKFLGALRSVYSAFKTGEFIEVYSNGGAYAFIRKDENCELLIAVNCGDKEYVLNFEGKLLELISGEEHLSSYVLKGNSCAVLINP